MLDSISFKAYSQNRAAQCGHSLYPCLSFFKEEEGFVSGLRPNFLSKIGRSL